MKSNEKKVIFLNRVSSPYIEQAIFVLKENTDCAQVSIGIVREAERIVAEYAKENLGKNTSKQIVGKIQEDTSTNAFSICEDLPDSDLPAFEFLQQSKRWRFFSFLKRHILKFILASAIMGAICAMVFLTTQI